MTSQADLARERGIVRMFMRYRSRYRHSHPDQYDRTLLDEETKRAFESEFEEKAEKDFEMQMECLW